MKAGVAKRDITPAVSVRLITGLESTGVHDPLYPRALVIDDGCTTVALVSLDLPLISHEFSDKTRAAVRKRSGIEHVLINASHTHSGAARDESGLLDSIVETVEEAFGERKDASLFAGRAEVQVGFNRRITNGEGQVSMGVNREGSVVPWVNVLVVRDAHGDDFAVLFEHAAHPVIVHDSSSLISGDYPAHAIAHIAESFDDGIVPIFVQGCGADINGYPISSGHDGAKAAGIKLAEATLIAMRGATEITADRLEAKTGGVMLPSQPLPSMAVLNETQAMLDTDYANGTESGKPVSWVTEEVHRNMTEMLNSRKVMVERGENSLPRRFGATAVMLGSEWCLVAMDGEMFCEYELWVDRAAPFEHTMALAYTNGTPSYIASDAALALGAKGGYEAGTYPCWWAHGPSNECRNTPAVGAEGLIRNCIESLWRESPPQDA